VKTKPASGIVRSLFLLVAWYLGLGAVTGQSQPPFYSEIQAFTQDDQARPKGSGMILFVGSSSFTFWKSLDEDFPGYPLLNRGFGGSSLTDLILYADQIIYPYKPRQIFIYCGENDFAADTSLSARSVFRRFKSLARGIQKQLPGTSIVYVSMKPSPSRKQLMHQFAKTNQKIQTYCQKIGADFIDVYSAMLNSSGQARPELFLEDQLHMNRKGYEIWIEKIKPLLKK
jgi:lysophospholipase L1-like esterase